MSAVENATKAATRRCVAALGGSEDQEGDVTLDLIGTPDELTEKFRAMLHGYVPPEEMDRLLATINGMANVTIMCVAQSNAATPPVMASLIQALIIGHHLRGAES